MFCDVLKLTEPHHHSILVQRMLLNLFLAKIGNAKIEYVNIRGRAKGQEKHNNSICWMVEFSGMKISALDFGAGSPGWSWDNFYIINFVLQSDPNRGKQMVRRVRMGNRQ